MTPFGTPSPMIGSSGPRPTGTAAALAPAPVFRVEHAREAVRRDGRFVPAARLVVLPALRTSGLLASLAGEEAKTLLMLLTFLTPNGRIEPTLAQVAAALEVPEKVAHARLLRLLTRDWRGLGPLAREAPRGGEGAQVPEVYRPAPYLLEHADAPVPPAPEAVRLPGAGAAAVVAASRAAFGRPREEVETEIRARLGRAGEDDENGEDDGSPEAEARRKLGAYGVAPDLAGKLVARFGAERALRQASWMAYRSARHPAALLVAAIERDYGEPPALLRARWDRTAEVRTHGGMLDTDDSSSDDQKTNDETAKHVEPVGADAAERAPALPAADLTIPPICADARDLEAPATPPAA